MNIYDVALKKLASRNRSTRELETYLKEKSFPEEEIKILIEEFRSYGYLNDEEYCRQYIRYALGKGKGRKLVVRELTERGIDGFIIEDVMAEDEFCINEETLARKEAEKVIALSSESHPFSEKVVGRVARRLQSKGYGTDIIYRIIGELRK